ncbi:MAG: SDR family oxidoreductase [Chloroflexota bacterium]|nr:SDR family oxidoreductase [Chloroflexota bacterium]
MELGSAVRAPAASDRVVLVTGAAGAIGSATVRIFLEAGFAVLGLDRDRSVAVHERGYRGLVVDLGAQQAVEEAIRIARSAFPGRLAHLVGVAGGALPDDVRTADDPAELDPGAFRASVDANLLTQFIVLRAALPWLREGAGEDRSVTFVSSFNGLSGWGMPAYSAAKAGIIGMMLALTTPLGRESIRVNVVAPGTLRTPRTEALWAGEPGHFEALEATAALGRLGTPDDVARSFLALATLLTHVTGQVLVVDGGQSVKRG